MASAEKGAKGGEQEGGGGGVTVSASYALAAVPPPSRPLLCRAMFVKTSRVRGAGQPGRRGQLRAGRRGAGQPRRLPRGSSCPRPRSRQYCRIRAAERGWSPRACESCLRHRLRRLHLRLHLRLRLRRRLRLRLRLRLRRRRRRLHLPGFGLCRRGRPEDKQENPASGEDHLHLGQESPPSLPREEEVRGWWRGRAWRRPRRVAV